MLFDTHAHLDFKAFEEDFEQVLERAKSSGVSLINTIGINLETSKNAIAIAEKHENIFATVGLHPCDLETFSEENFAEFERLLACKKVVAVGEIGLDYYHKNHSAELQHEIFRKYLRLAKKHNKAVVIHNRDAGEDILRILREENVTKGVMHCFSEDTKFAFDCIELGFFISFAGVVTFKNSNLYEVAKAIQLSKILVETDAPFLAPHPNRGKRNEPSFVKLTAQKIAEIKGISLEKTAETTTKNALELFGIV
ncbi:TatD family hydrolase [bacterium]|nr:TatD family hydrolase [bacterium]